MTNSNAYVVSRTVATVAIWPSIACALVAAFRASWNGDLAAFLMVIVIAILCGSAVAATAFVWRGASGSIPPSKPVPSPDEEWART